MVWANINTRIETTSRECISKMKKEVMALTTLAKVGFYNHNLTLCLLRYPKSHCPMDLYIQDNRKTGVVLALVKLSTWMEVSMMVNGKMIRSTEMVFFSISTGLNIMANGRTTFVKETGPTTIQMEIDTKDNGRKTFKMV